LHHLKRILGFALVPLLGVITPLIALPAVTSEFGATAWAAIAVATAVGGMLGAAVELGWSWNGPMRVARASSNARRQHLSWAYSTRIFAFMPLATIGGVIAYLIAPDYRTESALVAVAATASGLSLSWFFVGLGKPWRIVYLDAIPRVACVAASAIMLRSGAELWVYPVLGSLLPAISLPLLTLRVAGVRFRHFRGQSVPRLWLVMVSQFRVTAARVVSTTYMQFPVILVSGFAPVSQVAIFAGGDKLARMALSGMSPIPSMFQRWVGSEPSRTSRLRRAYRAIAINLGVGLLVGTAFVIAGPPASRFVFSGTADIALVDAVILSAMIAVVAVSRAVGGIGLVAAGGQLGLLSSAVCGAAIGLPLILVLTIIGGATGAFFGVLLSEMVVLATQAVALVRAVRRRARE